MDEGLERRLQEIDCHFESDPAQTLDCLAHILNNRHDHRYPRALEILHRLPLPEGDLGSRLFSLRAQFVRDVPGPDTPRPYRELTNPDDEAWQKELQAIALKPGDPTDAVAFTKAVINTFGNRLRSTRDDARRGFLTKHREFFADVLKRLEGSITPPDAVTLKNWVAESAMFKLQDTLDLAEKERTAERWTQVETCATSMQETPQSQEQIDRIDAALAQARSYHRWRRHFDELLGLISTYEFGANPLFPWSPPESIDAEPATTPAQIEEVRQGLEKWGTQEDLETWQKGLLRLSTATRETLSASRDIPAPELLERIRDLRRQWPDSLGPLPEAPTWDKAEAQLRGQFEAQVTAWLQELRDQFRDQPSLLAARDAHPDLPQQARFAVEEQRRFTDDAARLASIDGDLHTWWEDGDTGTLHDGRLDRLGRDLESLRDQWGSSPGYAEYRKRLDLLVGELPLLDRARQQLRDGDPRNALDTLGQCDSPGADRLREQARQSIQDDRIRIAIKEGKLDQIAKTDLERAGPETRTLYEQGLRGHDFVATLRRRAEGGGREQGFTAFSRTLLDLLGEQPPADVLLSRNDQSELERIRQELRNRIIRRAEHEVEELKSRASYYPPLDEVTLKLLEGQASDLAEGLGLPQLHPVDINRLLETIEPIRRGLRIHRACIDGDWQAAEAELAAPDLDAYLDLGQRRELLATLRTSRLLHDRAPDDSWLALYRELGDVLMRHQEPRARYLRLVRGATDGDHQEDLPILARWFPQETGLRSILACFRSRSISSRRARTASWSCGAGRWMSRWSWASATAIPVRTCRSLRYLPAATGCVSTIVLPRTTSNSHPQAR